MDQNLLCGLAFKRSGSVPVGFFDRIRIKQLGWSENCQSKAYKCRIKNDLKLAFISEMFGLPRSFILYFSERFQFQLGTVSRVKSIKYSFRIPKTNYINPDP